MSKVEAVKAEYEKKLAAAEREDAIEAVIPAEGRIHLYPLYGTIGSVQYGDEYAHGKAISMDRAVALVTALPPVAMTLVKGGSTSFRATSYVEALPEEKKERWDEESAVSSILIKIEGMHGPKVTLEWVTDVAGIGLLRVAVHAGDLRPLKIGTYTANRREFRGGFAYDPAKFSPADGLHTILDGGEPVAQLESPIRWAGGGDEYPSSFTLYFCDLGADADPAAVGRAIVRHLTVLGAPTVVAVEARP